MFFYQFISRSAENITSRLLLADWLLGLGVKRARSLRTTVRLIGPLASRILIADLTT